MEKEERTPKDKPGWLTRRGWIATTLMGIGLAVSYGMFAAQGLLFLLPRRVKATSRKLFAGAIANFKVGSAQTFHDLKGDEVLVMRSKSGFQAFKSTCPHLGCRVRWEERPQRFFCPCHGGVFNTDGVGIEGPPAWAGQSLARVPVDVDETSGVVYIEVEDAERKPA
jgi:Rieske Fe-S protein